MPIWAHPIPRSEALAKMGDEAQGIIKRGVGEAVCAQVAAGVDIPTDGEIARENYIHYHCRHLVGVDFEKRTEKKARIGNYCALLPTVCGAVSGLFRRVSFFLPMIGGVLNRPLTSR